MTRNNDEARRFWLRFDEETALRNLQLKDIAAACGIPYGSVTGWRNKHLFPDLEAITLMVKHIGCSLDGILGIKPVSEANAATAIRVYEYMAENMPGTISDILAKTEKKAGSSGIKVS